MMIGQRLRGLRESKKLSQGQVEKRTGLLRCYTSRVENGHTIPSLETLEKYASALEIPVYRFFYEGDKPPDKPKLPMLSENPLRSGGPRDKSATSYVLLRRRSLDWMTRNGSSFSQQPRKWRTTTESRPT